MNARQRQAAVTAAHGQTLVFRPLRLRPPRVNEVRVRLVACGICHTDLSCRAGAMAGAILGHEGAGIVDQVGKQVLRPGGTLVRLTGSGGTRLSEGRRIISVIQGDAIPQRFIPYLIAQWQKGRFPFDRLITHYPFHAINQALAAAKSGEAIKAVLRFT